MSDMGFSINCMHKKRERRHILNLVQNASRTLAFTSGLLEDFEGRLRVRRGRLDVYSTQQQPNNTKINTTIIGLNVRRERQATTIGENGRNGVGRGDTVLGSKGSGTERLRSKGSKDRELKVREKRSAGDKLTRHRRRKRGLKGTARPERKRYANWFRSAGQRKITRL